MTSVLRLSLFVVSAAACTTPSARYGLGTATSAHRTVVVSVPTSNSHLLAAAAQKRRAFRSVGHERASLVDQRLDPVPLMVSAAVLAAAGPPVVRSIRRLPRLLSWRPRLLRRKRDSRQAEAAGLLAPDGTLEDEQVALEAQRELDAWRTDSGSDVLSDAALGMAIVEWTTRGLSATRGTATPAAKLRELCTLLLAAAPGSIVAALRMATTAAARRTLGAGRDGSSLVATMKEDRCGALLSVLAVCESFAAEEGREAAQSFIGDSAGASTSSDDRTALLAKLRGVRMGVGVAFGFGGMDSKLEAAKSSVERRVLLLETRRCLADARAATGGGEAADTNGSLLAYSLTSLSPLLRLLRLPSAVVATTLLGECKDVMQAQLVAALDLWVARGRVDVETSRPADAGFELASRACRLAGACLDIAASSDAEQSKLSSRGPAAARYPPSLLAELRPLGLSATSRHAFYTAYVTDAAASAAAGAGDPARFESLGDARVMRRLLSVLPAMADAAERQAVSAAEQQEGAEVAAQVRESLGGSS